MMTELEIKRKIKQGWKQNSDGIWTKVYTPEEVKKFEQERSAWLKKNGKLKVVKVVK